MNAFLRPAALLLSFAAAAHAADWPQFRGPAGDGVVKGVQSLPLRWSGKQNVAWRTDLPGRGWSSPALSGGKLYLTTAVASGNEDNARADRSLRALCVDAATGKIDWNKEVFPQDGARAPQIHNKNSHASPTPVISDGKIYVHFGHQGSACLDLSGNKKWEQRSLVYQPVHGGGCSPLLVDGKLIFSCDGASSPFIAALDASSGKVAWKTERGNGGAKKTFSFSTPACFTVDGHKELISPASDALFGYDPSSGKELWKIRYDGYSVIPMPVMGNGLVYFSTGYDNPVTYAIRPGGKGDVTESHTEWTLDKRAPCTPSMLIKGDELYTVSDNGVVSCIDAKTGKVHWYERTGRDCSASPILFNDRIYVLDEYGTTTVVKADKARFTELAKNKLDDERTLASMTPDEGRLYIRTAERLYCISGE